MVSLDGESAPPHRSIVNGRIIIHWMPVETVLSIRNTTDETVHVDGTAEGSGTFLPHFDLAPGTYQRVVAAPVFTARDPRGRVIGSIDLRKLSQRSGWYDSGTYTFYIAITRTSIVAESAHLGR